METIKGFKDYIGEEAEKRQRIKGILAETFKKYGFELLNNFNVYLLRNIAKNVIP